MNFLYQTMICDYVLEAINTMFARHSIFISQAAIFVFFVPMASLSTRAASFHLSKLFNGLSLCAADQPSDVFRGQGVNRQKCAIQCICSPCCTFFNFRYSTGTCETFCLPTQLKAVASNTCEGYNVKSGRLNCTK